MFRHWRKAYKRHTHYYGICDTGMRSSHKRDGHIVFLIDNTCVIVALTVIKYAKSGCHVCVCLSLCVLQMFFIIIYTGYNVLLFIHMSHSHSFHSSCVCMCLFWNETTSFTFSCHRIHIHTYIHMWVRMIYSSLRLLFYTIIIAVHMRATRLINNKDITYEQFAIT